MNRVAWPAVAAVARADLRRRWRAVLALGLAVGILGALVAGALATARRSATAFDRLAAASAIDDARALVFAPDLADDVAALPGVERSWTASVAVARLDGPGVVYSGWMIGPEPPPGLFAPVVVAGRAADPDAVDEVVVLERYASTFDVGVGDELRFTFLTPLEVTEFDTGFGAPDGPTVTVRIVGLARLPGGQDQSPILATDAFADRYGAEVAAGRLVALRLADGPAGVPALRAEIDALIAASGPGQEGAEEFAPIQLDTPTDDRSVTAATARVLVGGLLVFAAVGAAVGLLAGGQALARHHAASAGAQEVEATLGLTRPERVLARVAALGPAVAAAAVVTVAGALAAGAIEPLGALGQLEPAPGWAPNVAVAAVGALATGAAVAALGAITAWRAGRAPSAGGGGRRTGRFADDGRRRLRLTDVPVPAPAALGVGLVVGSPGPGRAAPTRAALVGAVAAVAGVVATLGFAAALDRLVREPARWGWHGDVVVVDTTPAVVDELLADDRVAAATTYESTEAAVAGHEVQVHALTHHRGEAGWTMVAGRLPAAADEIVLGTRVADRSGADLGETVRAGDGERLEVVGIGIGPAFVGEPLGDSVVVTRAGLAAIGRSAPFTETMVRARPGTGDALVADLADRYEVTVREPPAEVANLRELGNLPEALGAFLAAIGVAALVHALAGTVRRRWRDLAVLRALGFSPSQTGRAVVAMALATALVGLGLGLPLGLALGRLVWWAVTEGSGVQTDATVPVAAVLTVTAVVPLVALLAGTMPARRAAAISPAALLRDAD